MVLPEEGSYANPYAVVEDQYQYLAPFPVTWIADPTVLDELSAAGVDAFTASGNHAFDFAHAGVEDTVRAFRHRDLPFAGVGRDLREARSPTYLETGGGRVGVVNATTSVPPGSEAGRASTMFPGRPGVNPLHLRWIYRAPADGIAALREVAEAVGIEDVKETWLRRENPDPSADDYYRFMHMKFEAVDDAADAGVGFEPHAPDREAYLRQVETAAANADYVVATLHSHQGPGGTRNVPETPAFLRAFARECVDAGADAVVGHGPHVLRGIEVYDGSPLFHSLGNFVYQAETVSRLPPDVFDYYDLDEAADVSGLFDARYYDAEGDPTGILADEARWETVVPTCTYSEGDLQRVDLHPCTLGMERPRSRRGTPMRATGDRADDILDRVADLSAAFGTTVEREGDVGVIRP